ncbi:mycobactin peptide synthetase MbtE [Thermoflexales bacterium]|nr:mycobactin peptide synthetase MbtE [Thermoflexales bacterium]
MNHQDLKKRVANLSKEQRVQLLQQLRNAQEEASVAQPSIMRQTRQSNIFPLSFAQRRLWLLSQIDSENPIYNVRQAFRLQGELVPSLLQQALELVVTRHETLRTTFTSVEGEPMQVIAEQLSLSIPFIDLTNQSDACRSVEVVRIFSAEALRPFDLTRGPLLRVMLLRLDEKEYALLLLMHHIVSDGWSNGILLQELLAAYLALITHQPPTLSALPIQYVDYTHWQRQWLQGDILEEQLSYWKQQLTGTPILHLPTDRPRPAIRTYTGASQSFNLSVTLTESLKLLSYRMNATSFMTLLAAFNVLLYRYSQQTDFCIGSPVANRSRPETAGLIGFFVNTLVLRVNLADNPTFMDLLSRVRQVTLEAYAHQDLPFEKLVEVLRPERSLNQTPLFQVAFAFQNAPTQPIEFPNIILSPIEIESKTAPFDLTLSMWEADHRFMGFLNYDADLFNHDTMQHLLQHFQKLLEEVVQNPVSRISHLSLLTKAEKQQLLMVWNNPKRDYSLNRCLHELFEEQVKRTPDSVAIRKIHGSNPLSGNLDHSVHEEITYQELDKRANQLARHLQSLGIGPETLVAVCLEPSPEMIVGILGVLKAGGAYLPLDPTYPVERLSFMLKDAQPLVVLTQASLMERLPIWDAIVICLDTGWDLIVQESSAELTRHARPDNIAYLIYTSGSTGQPKGALITHQSICNLVLVQIREFNLNSHCHGLLFASISFDASVSQIFTTLISGAALCLAKRELLTLDYDFIRLMLDEKITTIELPPSALAALDRESLPDLQTLVSAGEACSWYLFECWGRNRRFLNAYGPTETAVGCCLGVIQERIKGTRNVPIGRPIANAQLYILDRYLNLVPRGVVGEIYIGGIGVSRGYLNRANLTAEKFIPDLYSSEPGARLYKTGDLARHLPDGTIEFVGRIDHQVKVRGFRIELGEIEAALRRCPAVQDTVVLVREDAPDDKRLTAYIVAQPGQTLDVNAVRHFLRETLPDYMLPSAFVGLQALPLLANGKLDRQALPAPERTRGKVEAAALPRTQIEETLAEVWSDVLHVENISINDNYFDLGGDSLLATRVVFKANQLGIGLTARHIQQYQTIAQLAEVVGPTKTTQADQTTVIGWVPTGAAQKAFFARENMASKIQFWSNGPLLEVSQPLDVSLLEQATQALSLHHDILRLRLIKNATGWDQYIAPPGHTSCFTRIDLSVQSKIAGNTLDIQALVSKTTIELLTTLDVGQASLFQVLFFELGPQKPDCVLLLFHGTTADIASWQIVVEDLQTAYRQLVQGKTVALPPKTTSFKYFAERMNQYAKSADIRQDLEYWLDSSRRQVPQLPLDYDKGPRNLASLRVVTMSLSQEETRLLLAANSGRIQTPHLLIAALVYTLSRWAAIRSILLGISSFGRETPFEDVDLSRTVGWHTYSFPVLFQCEEYYSLRDVLQGVAEHMDRLPSKGVSYSVLRELSEDREVIESLQVLPREQVNLNYFGKIDHIGAYEDKPLFKFVGQIRGYVEDQQAKLSHLHNIVPYILESRLYIDWHYSSNCYQDATIRNLASNYVEAIRALSVSLGQSGG